MMEKNFRDEFEWLRQLIYTSIINQETKIMPALDEAKANLQQLKADVDTLLTKSGGVPEADVQTLADDLAALDADVKAKLGA